MSTHLFSCMLVLLSQTIWCQYSSTAVPALSGLSDFGNLRDFTISSNGDEAFFSLQSPSGEVSAILCVKKKLDSWSQPFIAPFSGKFHDLEPFLSPDNLSLYFASNRPLNTSDNETKDYDIWVVSRKNLDAEWGEPKNMGSTVNSDKNEFYPSIATNLNLYFTCDLSNSKGKDDIFFCKWEGDSYTKPSSLSESINSEGYEFNAFVAPDESYLIFTGYNRADGLGSGDLYMSYKKGNSWEKAKNMGKYVNSDKMDYCPFVDVNSKELYFTSKRSKLHVGKKHVDIDALLRDFDQYENGQSRLYKINIESRIR